MSVLLAVALSTVRPEPVDDRPPIESAARPSTSSGRTEKGSAVEAERAFAADAQRIGQWAAFRKWATADAIMFLPQPAPMQQATKDWPEPKQAVRWSPAKSFVSCDGQVAANTGPWMRPDGSHGFFSTIWLRQPDGAWKWQVDGGDSLPRPRSPLGAEPAIRRASCDNRPAGVVSPTPRGKGGGGVSPDRTLSWRYDVAMSGAREFVVELWTGDRYEAVITDRVAAPKP